MDRVRLPLLNDIYQERGFWKVRCWDDAMDEQMPAREPWREAICIGRASGPDRLTKKEAQQIARERYLARMHRNETAAQFGMTVTSFVETVFVPHHVQVKKLAGRAYYQAILKYVLPPEEVDRIFCDARTNSKSKLTAISDWPYLGNLPIEDCGPEHVQRLISAAHARGYSAQTVMHIRSVVRTLFSCAIRLRHYQHDNPAKTAIMPERPQRNPHVLTLTQVTEVLRAMRYPEKEMMLIAMLTSINVGEICGLQWKYVNLTGTWSNTAEEPIPPITIAVRKGWFRGVLEDVSKTRARNLPIPELLLPMLIKLSGRGRHTGPDDFVLVSRAGTPINAMNITARRLKSIGHELQMPWLTWQVFSRGRSALEAELGAQFYFHLASIFHADSQQGFLTHERWSKSAQPIRISAS